MLFRSGQRTMSVTGISIGGGNIQISELDGFKMHLNMGTPTFVVVHTDKPGVIANTTRLFQEQEVNIGTMTVTRVSKGETAIMIIEVDDKNSEFIVQKLEQVPFVDSVSFFN